jgi:hypothetical protein
MLYEAHGRRPVHYMYVRAGSRAANSTDSHVQARTVPQNRRQRIGCSATLARIFRDANVARAEPRKKPRASYRRFVYPAPNAGWQLDATDYVAGQRRNGPHSREFPASRPFPQGVAGVGFEPT